MFLNIILSLLLIHSTNGVYSVENTEFLALTDSPSTITAPERINEENIGVRVSADKYLVVDIESGKVLAGKHSNERQPLASITKMMTALVILDLNPDWQQEVTLSKVDETYGAYPHIYRGEQVKFIDLWKSALISSDNNSIMAMVRALGMSKLEFVELMNYKAEEIGLYNTDFADPTGLSTGNISTASDVARLIHLSLQKNQIKETVIQGTYEFDILNKNKVRKIQSTDILIDSFLNSKKYGYELIGGKTGYLPEAGYCLAVEITHENKPVIFVVLNSDTINSRFQDTKVLADWVFTNYSWR